MKLKELAEKVNKLPDKITYRPTRMLNLFYGTNIFDSKNLPETDFKRVIKQLEVENYELQVMVSHLSSAYNTIRDILLEAEIEYKNKEMI